MRAGCAILSSIVVVGLAANVAAASTITSAPGSGEGRVVIRLVGKITQGDAEAVAGTVKQAGAAGKVIEAVELNSFGGNLVEGAKLAAVIKAGKMSTSVTSRAVCASACFLAFAAGVSKSVGPGARIGVHKASETGGRETPSSGAATHAMARFARELGVPSWIIDRMLVTSPKQIAWLDREDLQAMGATTTSLQVAAVRKPGPPPQQQVREDARPQVLLPKAKELSGKQPWSEFLDRAIALSAEQNQGSPSLSRSCKQDSRECVMEVAYVLRDGRKGRATVVQDASGNVARREVCESNLSDDVRDCTDWDTGAKYRDLKNALGVWVQSVDQKTEN